MCRLREAMEWSGETEDDQCELKPEDPTCRFWLDEP